MFYKSLWSVSLPWGQDSALTFSPVYKAAALASPFLLSKAGKCLLKNVTSWCYKAPANLLHHLFFFAKGDKHLKTPHLDDYCHVFYEWPLNDVLRKKLSLPSFCRKYCTIKDAAQTYYFIANKSCFLFSIILKVLSLSRWEVIRTQGKCIKSYL